MKKILYIVIFTVISFVSLSFKIYPSQYLLLEEKIYYSAYDGKIELEGADVNTFEKLGYDYAKDSKHIYHRGKIVETADVESFIILGKVYLGIHDNAYAKDKYKVYFYGKSIEGIDLSTFEVFDNRIARDKSNVYFVGNRLSNIDISTFTYIEELCSVDSWCMFPESVFKDKNGVYKTNDKDFTKKFIVK